MMYVPLTETQFYSPHGQDSGRVTQITTCSCRNCSIIYVPFDIHFTVMISTNTTCVLNEFNDRDWDIGDGRDKGWGTEVEVRKSVYNCLL